MPSPDHEQPVPQAHDTRAADPAPDAEPHSTDPPSSGPGGARRDRGDAELRPGTRRWPRLSQRGEQVAWSVLPTAVFLALWELAGRGDLINVGFTSTPWAISRRVVGIVTTDGFGTHAWASLEPLAYGLLGAALSGVLAGLILAEIRWVRMTFEPAVMALYCTPRLALLPVLIIWMGIGMGRTVVIVWLGAVFPILINTMAGAFERDRSLSLAARSFGATRLTELRHVTIPACLPHIVTGFRIGSTRGLLGVIVSEMYASSAGIGFLIMRSANAVDVEGLMALAAITAIAGTTMTTSIRVGGSRLIPWRSESAVVV